MATLVLVTPLHVLVGRIVLPSFYLFPDLHIMLLEEILKPKDYDQPHDKQNHSKKNMDKGLQVSPLCASLVHAGYRGSPLSTYFLPS